MSLVVIKNVNFSYDGQNNVLNHISLSIKAGECVCLVGNNGSGKSTLAKLMNGLLTPDSGEVCINGLRTDIPDNAYKIRSHVGFVFQNPDDQIVATLVEDDVAFGSENLGLGAKEIRRRISYALDMVGLSGFEKREVSSLSGGEKQRVAIAGALAMQPTMLILDEATAMLDPANRKKLMDLLAQLNKKGITIVFVTHFPDETRYAQRTIVLESGCISEKTSLEKIPLPKRNTSKQPSKDASVLLELTDVAYTYQKDTEASYCALDRISLSIKKGELLGVAGQSGAGKSTLVGVMAGLLKPDCGHVSFLDCDLYDKKKARNLRKYLGVVFQYPEHQLFAPTVKEDIAFGPKNLGYSQAEIDERIYIALQQVGLDQDLLERSPFALSGGQQRRVALAGVLAMRPQMLILDEPTISLDMQGRFQLLELIARLCDEHKITIALISHDIEALEALCGRVITLKDGKIDSQYLPSELSSTPEAKEEL